MSTYRLADPSPQARTLCRSAEPAAPGPTPTDTVQGREVAHQKRKFVWMLDLLDRCSDPDGYQVSYQV